MGIWADQVRLLNHVADRAGYRTIARREWGYGKDRAPEWGNSPLVRRVRLERLGAPLKSLG